METLKIKVNGIELAYSVKGQGLPLILLHGNGEDKSIFNELAFALKENYTIYSIDTRSHGESEKAKLSYDDIAEDIHEFIISLNLKNATLLGFSDGGIVALKLAIKYPKLIERYFVLGANINPKGLSKGSRFIFSIAYFFTRDEKLKLMLKEPNILPETLNSIQDKCIIIVGENDLIIQSHTKIIADNVPNSKLIVLPKQTHSSYIVHNDFLKDIILNS